ncbi:hypothetical protein K503DRAFT_804462 [Rhizopogon vinicolor AM-OR11-026]|uniref:Uncharacterized protein n=1 Tax=Rhizopogon vinicolor AM-OR11-026 TaxID=1314800 RepID=A0A1B7ML35_9AGAM|nr:hypothetical protein K503DRAFT_804462 [Rhizopogon vinicolor AM-OR11-026]
MYNLLRMLKELADRLDKKKKGQLSNIKNAASQVITLTEMARQNRSAKKKTSNVIEEEFSFGGAGDELGVFGADDIQAVLKAMNYKIDFVPFGHPLIAVVSNVIRDAEKGYLKFV